MSMLIFEQIAKDKRNKSLNEYGINISVEKTQNSDYKYNITNGLFEIEVYRDKQNELDTLLQVIRYIDSAPHKLAFKEANAYNNSLIVVEAALKKQPSTAISDARADIQQRLRQANRVELFRNLEDFGINNIDQITSFNTIGLEDSKKAIIGLYMSLKQIAKVCEPKLVDYDSLIPITETTSENC